MPTDNKTELSFHKNLAYGFIGFPMAALVLPVYIFLPTYYAETLGLGLAAVGIARLVTGIWDVITDPIIGILGDKTPSKYGRRKSWILAGVPITIIGSYFLLIPDQSLVNVLYLIIWSAVMYLGWTMVILPLSAMGAELSDDYHERSKISAFREGFVMLGTVAVLYLVYQLGFTDDGDQAQALKTIAYFTIGFLILASVLFFIFVPDAEVQKTGKLSAADGLNALKKNKPFRVLIWSYFINAMANGLPATLIILFVDHVLKDESGVGPYLFTYFMSGVFAIPLWTSLSKKFGKHKIWCCAMLWACLFFALVPFVGEGDKVLFFAVCVLTGLAYGADLILPASMQADVVDIDKLETGQQRTGLFFALWSMSTKLSLAIAVGVAFPILDFTGFSDDKSFTLPLVALYAIVPIVLKLISISLMWAYPLTQETVEKTREEIEQQQ